MKLKPNVALADALSRAQDAPGGCATVPATAADLRALGALLSPKKRGRPVAKDDIGMMAAEYFDARAKGKTKRQAIALVLGERQDGSIWPHPPRRKRSDETFMRTMRSQRDEILAVLDVMDSTPEQVAQLRQDLADKTKSKSKRTRK